MTPSGEYEDTSGGAIVEVAPDVAPEAAEPVGASAGADGDEAGAEEVPLDLGEPAEASVHSLESSDGVAERAADEGTDEVTESLSETEDAAQEPGDTAETPEGEAPPEAGDTVETAEPGASLPVEWEDGEIVDLRDDGTADAADVGAENPEGGESEAAESEESADEGTDLGLVEDSEPAAIDDASDDAADTADLGTDVGGEEADQAATVKAAPDSTDLVTGSDLRNDPENTALIDALAARGMSLEAVARFDFTDNPVLGYRESAPAEDISYAVSAWNDQIAPGIATGATRDDFAAFDHANGLEGHQRLSGVYDYFLGDQAIESGGERENGSLDVSNGRHRLEQARLLGVAYLPVRN